MRHTILLDNKISQEEYEAWKKEDIDFWRKEADIVPQYNVLRYDFTDYPTEIDNDGDIRAERKWLQSLTDTVVSIYGQFGVDFIVVAIHEDNWKSDPAGPGGIWGVNYAYRFGLQTLQYCRWDRDNPANTFGTIYHERHHSLDAIIAQELGVRVEPTLSVPVGKYDSCITHGKCDGWRYIRHKENTKSLNLMSRMLKLSFTKRRERHMQTEQGNVLQRGLALLWYIMRSKKNRKDGVQL